MSAAFNGEAVRTHPRTIGWFGTTAVAMGGSNQSLFVMAALFAGQGAIPGQGSAAVVLLIIGVLLGWAAAPGWTELVLMYPNRVGGIAATCAEAFRPYSPVLANLTGVCYWWGWAPACAVGAMLSASAIHEWYLPWCSTRLLGTAFILFFTGVNLCGIKWVMRLAMPLAVASAGLAFLSALIPIFGGTVNWQQAFTFRLTTPFPGWFGGVTSVMAGLYLIGFLAPAFEQAASHVGETINPNKNVPRAMLASAAMAGFYFIVIPIVWLGTLGPQVLAKDLALVLGPTFAPLLGGAAQAAAIWFMVLNMFHGIVAPLSGASRTLSQLAEDGLLPEFMARRSRADVPWLATLVTAGVAITCLLGGIPLWLIAAANFTYLISIALTSVAVWLLRRDQPAMARPYRAPRGMILLGLLAAAVWMLTTILGFQQFGLATVLAGVGFAYSGTLLYAWRKAADRRKAGLPGIGRSLHLKLTGAMLLVLALDAVGYFIAVHHVPVQETALLALLADIFVAVAMLTIGVGLILPGMIAHSAVEIAKAADQLVTGTLADFTRAMEALAAGDLDAAKVRIEFSPVMVHSRDEVGSMALNFNRLQEEIARAAAGLEGAREGLLRARQIAETNARLQIDLAEMKAIQRSEAAVRESEQRFRSVAESANDAIVIVDENGLLLSWNKAASKMFGYDDEELEGKPLERFIPERFRQTHHFGNADDEQSGIARLAGTSFELAGLRKDGSEFPSEHSLAAWKTDSGTFFSAIIRNISERKQTELGIEKINRQLMEVSHQAGMTEVATSVLHNVGNVLNSVNVSCSLISDKVRHLRIGSIGKTAELLQEHKEGLAEFFLSNPSGQKLPEFFGKLAIRLTEDQISILDELQLLSKNVGHIKDIVAMQQNYAKIGGLRETLSVEDLVEDALRMNAAALTRHQVQVVREFGPVPPIPMDKHKVLQILVNLIRNAKHALQDHAGSPKRICVRIALVNNGRAAVIVEDNGIGIARENLTRIFAHGFTTKKNGHGFGLHSGVIAAQGMGGTLSVESRGPGCGAAFTLELPLEETAAKELAAF